MKKNENNSKNLEVIVYGIQNQNNLNSEVENLNN